MKVIHVVCTGLSLLFLAGCLAAPEPRPAGSNGPADRSRVRERQDAPGQQDGKFNPFDYLEPAPAPRLE